MARYTGPKRKLERRENATLFGSEAWKKRSTPPGQHGASKSRLSPYAIQFREKQKIKRTYGLTEKQFKNTYESAVKSTGNTGVRLLQFLELRLDNVVFKLGFAKTRNQARQFVNHGHVMVNGKKLDIPSYRSKIGDQIEIKEAIIDSDMVKIAKSENKNATIPKWLDSLSNGGKVVEEPGRESIDKSINEQFVVELYSR